MDTPTPTKATGTGYAGSEVTKPPPWHGLVVWDVMFNSLTTGLYLVAVLNQLVVPDVFNAVVRVAYPVALIFLLADLLLLVLDLGDPLRFHHMLRVFKPSSPMSLGVWSLTAYSLPLTVLVILNLLPGESIALEWARTLVALLGLPFALASAIYKGVLFSTSSQPGWKNARWLGAFLTSSALVIGCAEMIVVSIAMKQEKALPILRPALGLLLVLNAIPLCLLVADVRATLARIWTSSQMVRMGVLSFGTAVVLPLGLVLAGSTSLQLLAAVLSLLLGNLILRYGIVMLPHASP